MVVVGVESTGVGCENEKTWILEIGRKRMEKMEKRNPEDMWYKGLVWQSKEEM